MRNFYRSIFIIVAFFGGCKTPDEIYPLPVEWSKALVTESRLPLAGVYADRSPDMVGQSTTSGSLISCLSIYKRIGRAYESDTEWIELREQPFSIDVTVMSRKKEVAYRSSLKKDVDYHVDSAAVYISSVEDLRSAEGGAVVHCGAKIIKGNDGTLYIQISVRSGKSTSQQWYRFWQITN